MDNKEKYKKLGLKIAYYRKLNGLSQQELANMIHISRTHLSHIEAPNIHVSFSIALLFDIADALKVPLKDFFDF